ncbi:PH domain-containing protein [Pseudoxanthomonas suwonensis]
MTESVTEFDPPTPPAVPATGRWQPLPRRGAVLYAGSAAVSVALPVTVAAAMIGPVLLDVPRWLPAAAAAVLGVLLGGSIGLLRHRRIGWRLDDDGFATRRGGLWRMETLVPVSRVQHLDLERGPLERRLGLATLVVHTAGTRMAAVRLPLLALEDAEVLRDRLARQVEAGDAL